MRPVAALVVLSACTSPPCELDRLDDVPAAGPGEVRHGFVVGDLADLTATTTGVACLTCGVIYFFDGTLSQQRSISVHLAGDGSLAVNGDTTYVLDRDFGLDPEVTGGDYRPPHFQLFALSETGHERWRNDLGDGEAWNRGHMPAIAAGPASVVIYGEPLASVFSAQDGQLTWTTPMAHGDALVPGAAGELLFAAGASVFGPATPQATLSHLTGDGRLWTTTWNTTDAPSFGGGEISFVDAAPTADGGFVVTGEFDTATLDLGGQVLLAPARNTVPFGIDRTAFVAALGGAGGTQWAIVLGKSDAAGRLEVRRIAAAPDGVVICGDYSGAGQLGLPATDTTIDAFVARVDAGGAITAHAISGDGEQICERLAVGADGDATIVVQSFHEPGPGVLRVGSQTFDANLQDQSFILNMVL